MTDYHVHIGQWHNTYYEADKVFSELKNKGINEIWFSSTTSERYCKESIAVKDNYDLQKQLISARDLYELIRYEIQEAMVSAEKIGIKAHPLYWVVPEIHFSGAISIEQAMKELPYEGFKIHPRGNIWDLQNIETVKLSEEVFEYADLHNQQVLIHCGEDDFEQPDKFEFFIKHHKNCIVQLAHCRPIDKTIYMLKKYSNTYCDTAFVSETVIQKLINEKLGARIRFGSDYPISNII